VTAPGPLSFVYEPHPARVVFGEGVVRRLDDEAEHLGMTRALVITSKRLAGLAQELLGARAVMTVTDIVPQVPAALAASAVAVAGRVRADGLVALGGGSVIGVAKAVARESGLPIVAVPTTYSGSEMSSIWGITEGSLKRTGRDARVRPRAVLYDPELTRDLPPALAGASGLNGAAHAVEALYARDADPITRVLAEDALRALAAHLPHVVSRTPERRRGSLAGALYGAWLAGVCLDRAAMGVHHKICHVLGGSFGLPHAEVHAVVLPHAAAFNRDAAPEAMGRLSAALASAEPPPMTIGTPMSSAAPRSAPSPGNDAPAALFALAARLGAPRSLSALGMKRGDLDRAAELVTQSPYGNPRPVDRKGIRALLDDAFEGREPAGPDPSERPVPS
jgi:maleylacetate reductase